MAFVRYCYNQAFPKVDLVKADKEPLIPLLDAQRRFDRVLQIPECRRRSHRKLAQYPTQPHDAYRHVTVLAHDLARA